MAQLPSPRPSGNTPAVAGSESKPPGSIDYAPADGVGFELIPAAVVNALAGVLIGPPVAADAEQPVTKRQSDGTYYQQATGWWTGGDRHVVIDARRLLAPTEGQKLTPVTGWKIDGAISHFQPGVLPSYSQWRFDPGEAGAVGSGKRSHAEDPLEVLPAELTAPVRDAIASAWREFGRGWATETIVAASVTAERVRVLKAERKSTSHKGLDSADWHAVTLDAPITWIQTLATDSYGRVMLGQAVRPNSLAPGQGPNRSLEPGR